MSLPEKKILYFLIIILTILTSVCSATAESVVYFSQEEDLVSDQRLTLEDFTIAGESGKPEPGDSILLSYNLEYGAEMPNPLTVTLPKGLYFIATDPDGEEITVGGSYINEIIEPGTVFRVRAPFIPEKAGIWKFRPAYYVQDKRGVGLTSPEEWDIAEINVHAPSYLPDISVESAEIIYNEKFPSIVTLFYTVRNAGGAVIPSTMLLLEVDGEVIGEENESFLNPGDTVQSSRNIPADMVSEGSLIKITGDAGDFLAESNETNNVFLLEYSEFISGSTGKSALSLSDPVNEGVSPKNSPGSSEGSDNPVIPAGGEPCGAVNENTGIPVDYSGSCNIQFIVLGILAVIMSAVSFILGYLFSECGKGKREIEWLIAKVDRLKAENSDLENYNSKSAKQSRKKKDSKENRMKKAIDELKNRKDL